MNKSWLSKEKLLQYLLIVSIITISIVGLYVLQLSIKGFALRIFSAINSVLIPFIIAFFLSFIVGPLAQLIHKKLKIKRSIAIVIAILIGIIFILSVIGITVYFIVSQLSDILNSLLAYIDNTSFRNIITDLINQVSIYFSSNNVSDLITEMTENGVSITGLLTYAGTVLLSFAGFASSVFGIVMIFVLTPVFMFYLIREKELIFQSIAKIAPKRIRVHMIELGKRSDSVVRSYFKGQGLMMLIIFIFFSITLSVLSIFVPDFPIYYAIIFALLMGLLNIVPYIGAWIGVLVPIVFLLTNHLELQLGTGGNIYLIAMIVVLLLQLIEQVLEGSVIQPNVLGKQVHIHPLAILSALLFFGGLFGFAGVLLAVPLAGTIKACIDYFGDLNRISEIEEEKKSKQQSPQNKENKIETSKKKSFLTKKQKKVNDD